jgi:hypothetical protein
VCQHTSEIAYVFATQSDYEAAQGNSSADPSCSWAPQEEALSAGLRLGMALARVVDRRGRARCVGGGGPYAQLDRGLPVDQVRPAVERLNDCCRTTAHVSPSLPTPRSPTIAHCRHEWGGRGPGGGGPFGPGRQVAGFLKRCGRPVTLTFESIDDVTYSLATQDNSRV